MYQNETIVSIAHKYIKENLSLGSVCIDATAGRGNDTAFLANIVGENGKVYSFDIQEEALQSTKELIDKKNYSDRIELILDSHQNMEHYVSVADCVIFNLGYLPKGNHNIKTQKESTIEALKASLKIISKGGFIIICIYYGKDTDIKEKDTVLKFLSKLDYKVFTVILQQFYNRPNCPPIFAVIEKNL